MSGASSAGDLLGTGAATAVLFAAQGAVTGVLGISRERAEAICAIIAGDRDAVPVIADITDEAAVADAVDRSPRGLAGWTWWRATQPSPPGRGTTCWPSTSPGPC